MNSSSLPLSCTFRCVSYTNTNTIKIPPNCGVAINWGLHKKHTHTHSSYYMSAASPLEENNFRKINSATLPLSTPLTVSRPTTTFPPDIWGDHFLVNAPDETQTKRLEDERMFQELVEEIRRELLMSSVAAKTLSSTMHQLELIDSIQRLGIEYHFEMDIEHALQSVFETCDARHWVECYDIYSVALCFRLLRQHGYRVPCSIFEKFKDVNGKFRNSITNDMKGMLELYEASHLSIHGEDILDEAITFTRHNLSSILCSPNRDDKITLAVAEQIIHALKQPHSRGLTRLETRGYMAVYEQDPSHNKTLLKLAKLDFNRLQSLHKAELSEICEWWKGFGVAKQLTFVRDRMVESYFWSLGVYFEPKYSFGRKIFSKVISIMTILDDIYDAYGTFEELKIFTEAIERWSFECLDGLPEYMKKCYKGILELYEDIEKKMVIQGKTYRDYYAKEAIKIMIRVYFDEVKWRENNYTPTTNEYLHVATESIAYRSLTITSFLGMDDVATKDHFQWALENSGLIRAISVIFRLKNDIVGHEFEKERKHISSAVDCYMKEHNATKQEAITELNKQIEAAWKELNESLLKPTEIPRPLLRCVINLARAAEVMYKDDDLYTHVGPVMQTYIRQLLIDPIPIPQ